MANQAAAPVRGITKGTGVMIPRGTGGHICLGGIESYFLFRSLTDWSPYNDERLGM